MTAQRDGQTLSDMSTTIDLPEEAFRDVQQQAGQEGMDVSQFIADAISRQVSAATVLAPASAPQRSRSKLPTIAGRGTSAITNVTPELQTQLQEEEDLASYNC